MTCPSCRQRTEVIKTEPGPGGNKLRLRRCPQHGRFWTKSVEKVMEWVDIKALPATAIADRKPLPVTGVAVGKALPAIGGLGGSDQGISSSYPSSKPLSQTRVEPPGFVEFYLEFPRKKKRPDALKAWREKGCEEIAGAVMSGLVRQLPELRGRAPDKIPYPATWLRGREWEDPALPAPQTKDDRNGDLLEDFLARGTG